LSAAITARFPNAQIELVGGGKGVFNVQLDGNEIWDKHDRGGFPTEDAILDQLG
jgi:selT/selW/selH-like putative selenoprotein